MGQYKRFRRFRHRPFSEVQKHDNTYCQHPDALGGWHQLRVGPAEWASNSRSISSNVSRRTPANTQMHTILCQSYRGTSLEVEVMAENEGCWLKIRPGSQRTYQTHARHVKYGVPAFLAA